MFPSSRRIQGYGRIAVTSVETGLEALRAQTPTSPGAPGPFAYSAACPKMTRDYQDTVTNLWSFQHCLLDRRLDGSFHLFGKWEHVSSDFQPPLRHAQSITTNPVGSSKPWGATSLTE